MDRPAFVGAVAGNIAVSLSAELNIASRTARPGRRIMPLVCYRLTARTSAANTLIVTALLLGALAAASISAADKSNDRETSAPGVLEHHGNAQRSGMFVVSSLTWDRARNLHIDPAFHADV